MRHWSAFLDSVRRLNDFIRPGILRQYQADLLDRGGFAVASPFSGQLVVSRCNAVGPVGRTGYYFSAPDDFFLLLRRDSFEFGYPLREFVSGKDGARIRLWDDDAPWGKLTDDEFARLLQSGRNAPDRLKDQPAMLVLGHTNFAHQFWNELPALHEWLQTAGDETIARLPLRLSAEPLGPVREMFPRLSAAKLYNVRPPEIPLQVRLGGRRVPANVRSFVRDFVVSRGSTARAAKLRKTLMRGFPRVWISIRHRSRTPDNQIDFLRAVVRKLLSAFPDTAVVFDGFSFPDGFSSDPRMRNETAAFVERASVDRNLIEYLIGEIRAEHGARVGARLCATSELTLPEAIAVAGSCNFYLCHAGTLQHKIAWFHDVPGVIHTVPDAYKYALSCANLIEGALVPEVLPADLTVATGAPEGRDNVPRNFNYRITDVERAADAVVGAANRILSTGFEGEMTISTRFRHTVQTLYRSLAGRAS